MNLGLFKELFITMLLVVGKQRLKKWITRLLLGECKSESISKLLLILKWIAQLLFVVKDEHSLIFQNFGKML